MKRSPKIASIGKECVACGCCTAVCPRDALYIASGVTARLDEDKCVGCGKCTKVC
ncbi:4Fe-4S binding protein, partial [Ruthenibacterium lactatiformans]|uniref:4Fe-4S binding protein n=1 Tax=Ruthenibacterium lactatiformans TaxID=1550024 RepID=UPI0021091C50